MQKKIIAITTGDPDGIGLEIAYKALKQIKNAKFQVIVWASVFGEKKFLDKFKSDKNTAFISNITEVSKHKTNKKIFILLDDKNPTEWVCEAAKLCLKNKVCALVTGPLSKELIHRSGRKCSGHTEILKDISNSKHVRMSFVGHHFNTVLATTHIPLCEVSTKINKDLLIETIKLASKSPVFKKKKPIAILGLNPHSGENGLIGNEEIQYIIPVINILRRKGYNCVGPIVPDVAFQKDNWKKYSYYLSLYHDQALIPFKMVHGKHSGVNYTLGLPFIRTSVDHGTAKDLYGKNKANAGSMIDAISLAMKLSK